MTTVATVIIPACGEAPRIERCLAAILAQDWPRSSLEVVVVDGSPGDGTAAAARSVLATAPGLRSAIVENPGGGRSANLNRGLAAASGEVVCRVDARAAIPPHYVRTCVERLADPSVAVVGGSQVNVPPGAGALAAGIARGLNNRFAMGMAQYRRRGPSGPADTVYLGAFRAADLRSVGGWDEALAVNEDFDLNQRMAERGSIWFASELAVAYQPRSSLGDIARQYWGFGRWKVRYLRASGAAPRRRQVVALGVVPGTLAAVIALGSATPAARRRALVLAGVAAGVVEHLGGTAEDCLAPLSVRLWSIACSAVVVSSWSLGAWAELVAGGRLRSRRS